MIKYERQGTYSVKFTAYNGLVYYLVQGGTKDEVIDAVKKRLRRARRDDQPYSKTGKLSWELETPEDAVGIGDSEGFMEVVADYRRYRRILGRKVYLENN